MAPPRSFGGRVREAFAPMFGFSPMGPDGADKFAQGAQGQRFRRVWDEEAGEWLEEELPPPPLTPAEKLNNAPLVAAGMARLAEIISSVGGPKWLKRFMPERMVVALQSGISAGVWERLQDSPNFCTVIIFLGCIGAEPKPEVKAEEKQEAEKQEAGTHGAESAAENVQ